MQTKPKANSVVTSRMIEGGRLEFTVLTQPEPTVLVFDPAKVSQANRSRAEIHGWTQRIVDAAAVTADKATGKVDRALKAARMRHVIAHYEAGGDEWNAARAAAPVKGSGLDTLALAAVAEALGMSLDEARARVVSGAEKRGCTQAAYLASACDSKAVAPILARMRDEAAKAGPGDSDELLAEMQGVEVEGETGGEGESESAGA